MTDKQLSPAVVARAAALGVTIEQANPSYACASYVLRSRADGSAYDVWPAALPLAGIFAALDCLEREREGDESAWANFGDEWEGANV